MKPRERWIATLYEESEGVYQTRDEALENSWMNSQNNIYHVIEKSAYDAVMQERDKLNEQCLRMANERLDAEWPILKERDALSAQLVELKAYLPKVPTEPYEKQMAKEIVELKALLAEAKKLRECVELFMMYTTPEDCPHPHVTSIEATESFDKLIKRLESK